MRCRGVPWLGLGLALVPQLCSGQAYQNVVLRNSFNPLGAGARGLGMGGAFIAVADDGTAASFNPAGLAQVRRSELALVGFGDVTTASVKNQQGGLDQLPDSQTRRGALDFAGLSVPFDASGHKLTVEVSYQRSVDLFGKGRASATQTVALPPGLGGPGTAEEDYFLIESEQHGAFHTANLAAGFEVTNRLSLGAAASYWISEWTAQGTQSLKARFTGPGIPESDFVAWAADTFKQTQSFRGIGLTAGFLLRYPRLSIGGVARFPFTARYQLDESGRRQTHFPTETDTTYGGRPEDRVLSRLSWPWSAGVGIAFRPLKGFTLAVDYTHAQWSQMVLQGLPDGSLQTEVTLDRSGQPIPMYTDRNFFDLNAAARTATQDTNGFRVGVEYLVTTSKLIIPIRLGGYQDQSPVPDLEKYRRFRGFTIGTGLNLEWIKLDLAADLRESRGDLHTIVLPDQTLAASPGVAEEIIFEVRLVASLILRFGGRGDDPLKRLFRYLFVGSNEEG